MYLIWEGTWRAGGMEARPAWLELSEEADKVGGARSHRAVVVTSLSISFQIQGKPLRAFEKGSHSFGYISRRSVLGGAQVGVRKSRGPFSPPGEG